MTVKEIAQVFNAKRIGKGKYVAICPSHPDRKPSLSIAEGKRGVLMRCMSSGCDTRDVLKAVGLTYKDLFDGEWNPQAMALHRAKVAKRERIEKQEAKNIRYWVDETRKWERVAAILFHLLLSGKPVARLWHRSLHFARLRHERLLQYWPGAPWVECYSTRMIPKDITAQFVGKEIAEAIGLEAGVPS